MKRVIQLFVLLCAAFLVRPTFLATADAGNCWSDCFESWNCGFPNSGCGVNNGHAMEMCDIQCKGKNPPVAFGAIAYSTKDKNWGFTYGQKDKATAERLAMQYCAKQGGVKCSVAASFNNTCGAIAASADIVAWGTDGTKYNAQVRAVAECKRLGGKQCEAQASICSR